MRKLTRTEANFENLLEAALLVEGHCSHASRGCCCRGCSECEENYSENNEGELTLKQLIDRELGPNTDVPYGDDPRADDDEYDNEENEGAALGGYDSVSKALELVTKMPEGNRFSLISAAQRRLAGARDKIAKGVEAIANKFAIDAAKIK